MSDITTGLTLKMPLDEFLTTASETVLSDRSGNARNSIAVHGTPQIVPDDNFGSCLSLDGVDDSIELPADAIPAGTQITVTLWACEGDGLPRKSTALWSGGAGEWTNLAVNFAWQDALIGFDCGNASGAGHDRIEKRTDDPSAYRGKWVHWAFTKDAEAGVMKIYKDGGLWHSDTAKTRPLIPSQRVILGNREGEEHYRGKLACVRIYDRVLSAGDIGAIMRDDQTAHATFKMEYPIDFRLSDDDEQSVLYISEEATLNRLQVVLENCSARNLELLPAGGGQASVEHHHLELKFKPKTFDEVIDGQTADRYIRVGAMPKGDWAASAAQIHPDGTISLYLLYTGADPDRLEVGNSLAFTLEYGSADAMAGARSTRVQLQYRQLRYQGENAAIEGTRIKNVDVINQRGKKQIPLHVGIVGANTILNDADAETPRSGTESTLKIRLVNALKEGPVRFLVDDVNTERNTKFTLLFDDPVGADWDLASVDQLNAIQVSASLGGTACEVVRNDQGAVPAFEITPAVPQLGPQEGMEITLANIHSNSPSGFANLYLRYEDVPGHWDGQFVIPVEKSPITHNEVNGRRNVGIGVAPTDGYRLSVSGSTRISTPARVDASALLVGKGDTDHFVVKNDGRVGIGTPAPSKRLTIKTEEDGDGIVITRPNATAGGGVYFNDREVDSEVIAGIQADRDLGGTNNGGLQLLAANGTPVQFFVKGSQSSSLLTGTEEVMRVGGDGKVGIGTADPRELLELRNTHPVITFHTPGRASFKLGNDGNIFKIAAMDGGYGGHMGSFSNNDKQVLSMTTNGNVGIGTTSPGARLDVNGDIRITSGKTITLRPNDKFDYASKTMPHYGLGWFDDGWYSGGPTAWFSGYGGIKMFTTGKPRMTIDHQGNVIIQGKLFIEGITTGGWGSHPYALVNASTGELTKSKDNNSDLRLKEEVTVISDALGKVMALRGVSYRWNEEGLNQKTKGVEERMRSESNDPEDNERVWAAERQRIRKENAGVYKGFIAQEVERIFPEWVQQDKDGYKTLHTSELLPVLVEAIKEQQQHIREQQQLIERLAARLDALDALEQE